MNAFVRKAMTSERRPVGFFVVDDDQAERLIQRLLRAGHDIPRDAAVVGAGNLAMASFRSPVPISSVQFRTTAIGETAADMLLAAMAGKRVLSPDPIPPLRVVARESTGAGMVRDDVVDRALELMREHMADQTAEDLLIQTDIKVEAVARMCGYGSARSFIRMFKSVTDQPPGTWRQSARVPIM